MNGFNITKPCTLCGKTGHTFDGCEELTDENIKPAYIKLRLLCNQLCRGLSDLETRSKDLNYAKTMDLNQILSLEAGSIPTHPVTSVSPISSLGIVPDRVPSVTSSLDETDCKKLNSLFGHVNESIRALTKGLDKTNSVISNLASVMYQQVSSSACESDTDDGSSTLGGRSGSTTNTLNLLQDLSDFQKGRYI